MVSNVNNSSSGFSEDAPIAVYAGSKENADLLASKKKVYPGNIVGATYAASTVLGTDDIDYENDSKEDDENKSEDDSKKESDVVVTTANPFISDISIISNQVVYDAAGNPSVTVVLKVKNSSGQELKGINARVQAV